MEKSQSQTNVTGYLPWDTPDWFIVNSCHRLVIHKIQPCLDDDTMSRQDSSGLTTHIANC